MGGRLLHLSPKRSETRAYRVQFLGHAAPKRIRSIARPESIRSRRRDRQSQEREHFEDVGGSVGEGVEPPLSSPSKAKKKGRTRNCHREKTREEIGKQFLPLLPTARSVAPCFSVGGTSWWRRVVLPCLLGGARR